jgi:hypothetical protein
MSPVKVLAISGLGTSRKSRDVRVQSEGSPNKAPSVSSGALGVEFVMRQNLEAVVLLI